MKGAMGDPLAKTKSNEKIIKMKNIGNNQYFFLARRKINNSFIKLNTNF